MKMRVIIDRRFAYSYTYGWTMGMGGDDLNQLLDRLTGPLLGEMNERFPQMGGSMFLDSSADAADCMARNAIRQCLSAEFGSDSYTVDSGKVVVEARFVDGVVAMCWTVAFKEVSREQAIAAISTRMKSRLG